MSVDKLLQVASSIGGTFPLKSLEGNSSGTISSALITKQGNIYSGVSLNLACGIGFCAEHAAVAEMLKNHETEIMMIVAINQEGFVIPPCGRCRELLVQIDKTNLNTEVYLGKGKYKKIKEMLPDLWFDWRFYIPKM